MLPYLEVARLPPSSSFYAATLQPLGLGYLSAASEPLPSVTFGDAKTRIPVFRICQPSPSSAASPNLKRSHVYLAAPSAAAVCKSYRLALASLCGGQIHDDPGLTVAPNGGEGPCSGVQGRSQALAQARVPAPHPSAVLRYLAETGANATEARITDLDGNIMDIVYHPYPSHSPHDGSTLRKTQSTNVEAARILDWNFDVASSNAQSVVRRPRSSHDQDSYDGAPRAIPGERSLRRSVTTTTTVTTSVVEPPPEISAPPHQNQNNNSSGFTTGTVVSAFLGAAVGVAAGAAVTYGVMRGERPRASPQEVDGPPAVARRSTFPADYMGASRKGRFVEVERRIEKMHYPADYQDAHGRHPPPEYIASYTQVAPANKESQDAADAHEELRSRHSSHSRPSGHGCARLRSRSEAGTTRLTMPPPPPPLLLTEAEHRSHVGSSKVSKYPPIVQRSYSHDVPERPKGSETGSFASARSHRSSSTVRASPAPMPMPAPVPAPSSHAHASSRTHSYRPAWEIPLQPSRVGSSHFSARHVPLPSNASGRGWDDDGDDDSIAPSDSISNVGSRRSARSRYY